MFSSRITLNIALILALFGLIALAVITAQKDQPDNLLSTLAINQVNSIKIQINNTITSLIKADNIWTIQQPLNIEADDFRVNAILNILKSGSEKPYTIDKTDLKKFSLNPALATLTLNQQEILFGTTSAVNDKRYIYTSEKLFLINDQFYPLITSGYKNLMRRQLFPANSKINDISFDKTHLYKKSNGSWVSEKGTESSDDLKRYIDNWQHIQAYAVTKSSPPFTGSKITIKTDSKTYRLLLVKSDNTTVINPELGLSYQFDLTAYEALINPGYYIADIDTEADKK